MTTGDGSETRREQRSARCVSSGDGEFGVVQIGAGAAGVAHMRTITTAARCRLVAVADTAARARQAAAAEFGVPTYEDYRKMLADHGAEADIAVLVLPHHAYPDALEAVAEFGLHILKEKPFARSLREAETMAAVLRRHEGVYMTAGQRMFDPAFAQLVDLARTGELGEVYLTQAQFLYSWRPDGVGWGWRGDRELSGGIAIIDSGWHILDALRACKGRPARVHATTGAMKACPGQWTSDEKAALLLEYPDGSIANVVVCPVALPDRFEILLHGTEGNLEVRQSHLARYSRRALVETRQWPAQDLVALQLSHFLDCLSGKSEPRCGLNESLEVQAVIEAAYQSATRHHPVEVSELSGAALG